jgi:hypothetical protein
MSNSRRRRARAARERPAIAGRLLVGAGALLLAALVLAPWLAGRLSRRPYAPAVAAFVALVPAAYFWFRRVQQTRPRVALALALAYATLAAGVLWVWNAR